MGKHQRTHRRIAERPREDERRRADAKEADPPAQRSGVHVSPATPTPVDEAPRAEEPRRSQAVHMFTPEVREAMFRAVGAACEDGDGIAIEALRAIAWDLDFFWSAMGDGEAPPNYEMVRALFGRLKARAAGAVVLAELLEAADRDGQRATEGP